MGKLLQYVAEQKMTLEAVQVCFMLHRNICTIVVRNIMLWYATCQNITGKEWVITYHNIYSIEEEVIIEIVNLL